MTGDKKYLEPIPRALAYYQKLLLPDGRIARYYEFKTNKALYMNANYQLTYDDSAAPSHYGWKQPARFKEIAKKHEDAKAGIVAKAADLNLADVRKIIKDLDAQGRWITTHDGSRLVGQPKFAVGFQYISSDVVSRNVEVLSRYIGSKSP